MRLTLLTGLCISLLYLTSCQSEKGDPEPDCTASGLTLTLDEKTQASCGGTDGSATVEATGGEAPYTFTLSGTDQEDGLFEGLSAGNHAFEVTDANGCTASLEVTIETADGVTISSVDASAAGCGSASGTVSITASNGAVPYQYKLGDGAFQESNAFSNLGAGSYMVTVVDDAGCEFTETVDVLSGVSLEEDIMPLISENCATATCHGGSVSPNLESKNTVINRASSIKTLTGNGTMPKNGSLTQAQIDMIACWVDDGALDN